MHNFYHGVGGFSWIGILLIIAIVVIVYLLLRDSSYKKKSTNYTSKDPEDILKERLAKGEINLEEYRELKKELEEKD